MPVKPEFSNLPNEVQIQILRDCIESPWIVTAYQKDLWLNTHYSYKSNNSPALLLVNKHFKKLTEKHMKPAEKIFDHSEVPTDDFRMCLQLTKPNLREQVVKARVDLVKNFFMLELRNTFPRLRVMEVANSTDVAELFDPIKETLVNVDSISFLAGDHDASLASETADHLSHYLWWRHEQLDWTPLEVKFHMMFRTDSLKNGGKYRWPGEMLVRLMRHNLTYEGKLISRTGLRFQHDRLQ